jgi:two-component system chemotaxis response regulator CheY
MEKDGNRVLEAGNGYEALAVLQKEEPHLVITDIIMPELDGLTLIAEIRKIPQHAEMPILVVSTESPERMKNWSKEKGVTGWLVKPFHPERIREVVQHTLRLHEKTVHRSLATS